MTRSNRGGFAYSVRFCEQYWNYFYSPALPFVKPWIGIKPAFPICNSGHCVAATSLYFQLSIVWERERQNGRETKRRIQKMREMERESVQRVKEERGERDNVRIGVWRAPRILHNDAPGIKQPNKTRPERRSGITRDEIMAYDGYHS